MVETEFPAEDKFAGLEAKALPRKGVAAFLTVQEGCDKFCSFCVVPYTRGSEFSRPVEQVLAEARRMAAQGVKELTLLGQNVNAYHGLDGRGRSLGLAGLVAELSRIDGIERLRYTTSHPRDMTDELIAAHAENPKLMPYLHLPVQSGSDSILKSMNRGHTAESYLRLIEKIRGAKPDMALSGDFIVGFPGETADDFESTLDLIRQVNYASAYSFKYSPRPGTPAAESDRQVPESEKSARLQELQKLVHAQQTAFNAPWWAERCRSCWKSRGGTRASWSDARPISSPFTFRRTRHLSERSWIPTYQGLEPTVFRAIMPGQSKHGESIP